MYSLRVREAPVGFLADRWQTARAGERLFATIEGVVVSGPKASPPPAGVLARFVRFEPKHIFTVRANVLVGEGPVCGDVICFVSGDAPLPIAAGDRVRITGLASAPHTLLNPGDAAMARFARQSRLGGTLSVSSADLVLKLSTTSTFERVFSAARSALDQAHTAAAGFLSRVEDRWGADAGATAAALILGEQEAGIDDVRQRFTRLGILHALAISGFHLSVLTFMCLFLMRALSRGGGRPWVEPLVLGSALLLYALILPTQPPITRAVIMGLALVVSEAAGRRYDRLTILCWTSTGLLLWHPADLWSLGYQLSCGLTGLLLWLGTPAFSRIWGAAFVVPGVRTGGFRAIATHWIKASVASSILCWLVSLPIVWASTGYLSPLAVIATVLVSPVLVGAMGAGYVAIVIGVTIGSFVPMVATAAAWIVGLFTKASLVIAEQIDRVPGSGLTGPPIAWWAALFTSAAVIAFFALGKQRALLGWLFLLVSPGICAISIAINTRLPAELAARIDTFAVGDGSCHLIRSGGNAVLWDAGSLQYSTARRVLPQALREVGAWRIPTAIITHGDFDHFNALPELVDRFGIREVLVGERFLERASHADSAPAAFTGFLRSRGVTIRTISAGDVVSFGRVSLTFLSPDTRATYERENDYSLIARLDGPVHSSRALAVFTGDAQSAALNRIRGNGLRSWWVEAPHHASANADAAAWVRSLEPALVIASTGPLRLASPSWRQLWPPATGSADLLLTPENGWTYAEFSSAGLVRRGSMR